jgi:hypothetical protein
MSSRRVSEEYSVGEKLVRAIIAEHAVGVAAGVSCSAHLVRVLNELQDDLSRHAAARFSAALAGRESGERATAALAAAGAIADAKVRVVDAAYGELDACVRELDRRLKLGDAVLRLHGQVLEEPAAAEEEGKFVALTRPADAISARVGRRSATPTVDVDAGARAREAKERLVAAVDGVVSAPVCADSSAHESAISALEPVYCVCRQVAFGEMIACENEACATEWFHYSCVGLTSATRPLGAWTCPKCSASPSQPGGPLKKRRK